MRDSEDEANMRCGHAFGDKFLEHKGQDCTCKAAFAPGDSEQRLRIFKLSSKSTSTVLLYGTHTQNCFLDHENAQFVFGVGWLMTAAAAFTASGCCC